jgi:uroporphyrinogen-III synthase
MSSNASQDPRFRAFSELPEDSFEAFLSVPVLNPQGVVGVINLQHRRPHIHSKPEIKLVSTIGFLVGAAIEMARLEDQNLKLSAQLETRKLLERAKGILQREMGMSEEQAYLALQRQSRQMRKPMKEIAEAVILSEELKRNQQTRS